MIIIKTKIQSFSHTTTPQTKIKHLPPNSKPNITPKSNQIKSHETKTHKRTKSEKPQTCSGRRRRFAP